MGLKVPGGQGMQIILAFEIFVPCVSFVNPAMQPHSLIFLLPEGLVVFCGHEIQNQAPGSFPLYEFSGHGKQEDIVRFL